MVPVKKHEASEFSKAAAFRNNFSKAAAFRNNFFLTFAADFIAISIFIALSYKYVITKTYCL